MEIVNNNANILQKEINEITNNLEKIRYKNHKTIKKIIHNLSYLMPNKPQNQKNILHNSLMFNNKKLNRKKSESAFNRYRKPSKRNGKLHILNQKYLKIIMTI